MDNDFNFSGSLAEKIIDNDFNYSSSPLKRSSIMQSTSACRVQVSNNKNSLAVEQNFSGPKGSLQ